LSDSLTLGWRSALQAQRYHCHQPFNQRLAHTLSYYYPCQAQIYHRLLPLPNESMVIRIQTCHLIQAESTNRTTLLYIISCVCHGRIHVLQCTLGTSTRVSQSVNMQQLLSNVLSRMHFSPMNIMLHVIQLG
jgi:hypothetical protein